MTTSYLAWVASCLSLSRLIPCKQGLLGQERWDVPATLPSDDVYYV